MICYYQGREEPALPGKSTDRGGSPSNDIILDKKVLNMEPVLKPQPKLLSLDDKILLSVARANVLSQITVCILSSQKQLVFKAFLCLFVKKVYFHCIESAGAESSWQQSE